MEPLLVDQGWPSARTAALVGRRTCSRWEGRPWPLDDVINPLRGSSEWRRRDVSWRREEGVGEGLPGGAGWMMSVCRMVWPRTRSAGEEWAPCLRGPLVYTLQTGQGTAARGCSCLTAVLPHTAGSASPPCRS